MVPVMRKKNRALRASILRLIATIMTSMVIMIVDEYLNVLNTRKSRNSLRIVNRKYTVYYVTVAYRQVESDGSLISVVASLLVKLGVQLLSVNPEECPEYMFLCG